MSGLEVEIIKIHSILNDVSLTLDQLSFENFDEQFPQILEKMGKAKNIRAELLNKYNIDQLRAYDTDLHKKTKLIEGKYDNIVEVFSNEKNRLEKELAGVLSKKKINNYQR